MGETNEINVHIILLYKWNALNILTIFTLIVLCYIQFE